MSATCIAPPPHLPWTTAKAALAKLDPDLSFERLLGSYIKEGCYVWSSPDEFILAIPCIVDGKRILRVPLDQGEGWFIHIAAAGDRPGVSRNIVNRFQRLAPQPLPWIIYHRRERLHRIRWRHPRPTTTNSN